MVGEFRETAKAGITLIRPTHRTCATISRYNLQSGVHDLKAWTDWRNGSEAFQDQFRAGAATGRAQLAKARQQAKSAANPLNISRRRGMMAEEMRDRFEVPRELRSVAEASVEQARKAFERLLETTQATAGALEERGETVRAGARDIGAKAIGYAEQNVQASLDHAQSLVHARDLGELMRLQSGFIRTQMSNLAEQAKEMGHVVSRAAADVARPKK
jgi:phasin